MAGLIKQKQYDWKDSNLALFGSDTERQVKKESAESEPAWKKAGEKVGVQIWRINKFKVEAWPKDQYGEFYDGDSYIILNTFQEEGGEEFLYDVHFWIGKYSTQDEYCTAAYKTVELDTFLDDKPIQHREVQFNESAMFKSYFKTLRYLHGGAESGFRQVKPTEYKPRLLHFFCGDKKNVQITEIPRQKEKLDSGDVYILDLGRTIYQWNGSGSNKNERVRAAQFLVELKGERAGKATAEVLEEADVKEDDEFLRYLDGGEEEDFSQSSITQSKKEEKKLYRVSDATGSMDMKLEKEGKVSRGDFDTNDVFIYDTSESLFVWIGKRSSPAEKKNAMAYAHKYLTDSSHPLVPVTCLPEGRKHGEFDTALAA